MLAVLAEIIDHPLLSYSPIFEGRHLFIQRFFPNFNVPCLLRNCSSGSCHKIEHDVSCEDVDEKTNDEFKKMIQYLESSLASSKQMKYKSYLCQVDDDEKYETYQIENDIEVIVRKANE